MKAKVVVFAMVFAAMFAYGKTTILNLEKGELFDNVNLAELNLTEEHAVKKGSMMLKVDLPAAKGEDKIAWSHFGSPKKSWKGFSYCKFTAFNPGTKPVSITLDVQPGGWIAWAKRFGSVVMLKPGKTDVEIELEGAMTNDGTGPVDWDKAPIWGISYNLTDKPCTIFISSVTLEKEEKEEKKK
jgi:hypothetical protein